MDLLTHGHDVNGHNANSIEHKRPVHHRDDCDGCQRSIPVYARHEKHLRLCVECTARMFSVARV